MIRRARRIIHDVHRLAAVYHWSEREILSLPTKRRLTYLKLIEAELAAME